MYHRHHRVCHGVHSSCSGAVRNTRIQIQDVHILDSLCGQLHGDVPQQISVSAVAGVIAQRDAGNTSSCHCCNRDKRSSLRKNGKHDAADADGMVHILHTRSAQRHLRTWYRHRGMVCRSTSDGFPAYVCLPRLHHIYIHTSKSKAVFESVGCIVNVCSVLGMETTEDRFLRARKVIPAICRTHPHRKRHNAILLCIQ